jgi:metal-responsive CopG/Arc/MetJ family transcriptional regulator
MRRAASKKSESRLINVYFPVVSLPLIDAAVVTEDTDRSKFIRKAVREKLERMKASVPQPQ